MLLILEIVAAIFVLVVLLCLQTLSRGYRKPGCTRPPLVTRFSVLPQALLARSVSEVRSFELIAALPIVTGTLPSPGLRVFPFESTIHI